MTRTVREIMNPELLSICDAAPATETLERILDFGVTAVPVLDDDGRPTGVTSLRDLVRAGPEDLAPVTSPASTVALTASVTSVAETMVTTGRHHLVVVGADGKAVGMVSTLDVIRALLGKPPRHPPAFARKDDLGLVWSPDEILDETGVAALPREPGALVLVRAATDEGEESVSIVSTPDLRESGAAVLARAREAPELAPLLECGRLRLRYTVIHDEARRAHITRTLRDRIDSAPPPGST